jgi:hypothetical protein
MSHSVKSSKTAKTSNVSSRGGSRKNEAIISAQENSWNPNLSVLLEPRRRLQMSLDIKGFLKGSDDKHARKEKEAYLTQQYGDTKRGDLKALDPVAKLYETFGLKHYEGTDQNLEIDVVKIVLKRDGLLMKLKFLLDKPDANKLQLNILELLSEIRESTINYLQALCRWRQSFVSGSPELQTQIVFRWENKNYTLRLVNDLDFMAKSTFLAEVLDIPRFQLQSNPLMLSNNLEDPNNWVDPYERAIGDLNGQEEVTDAQFEVSHCFAAWWKLEIYKYHMPVQNIHSSHTFICLYPLYCIHGNSAGAYGFWAL